MDYGVPSTVEPNTLDNIGQALSNGQGVTADVDVRAYWTADQLKGMDMTKFQGHEVAVTGIEYDDNGNVSSVIVNDTGTGQCSFHIPIDKWNKAVNLIDSQPVPHTNPIQYYSATINVTSRPIF
jgi:hypothetical protein